ncbi:uncharacterized protein LOC121874626 [Homarus americanus]|uniref:uncharacterized protein LOC121874626 n=1 Tax=Homarus americanus TaxID=6706 RepID=UPI001C472701|nr:uncharacterized protein LOC121874626 [Homarus americanus]
MLVQVQHLSMRVKQLATEVEQKQRQLDELLPDVKSNTKSPVKNSKTTRNKDNLIESAIESVVVNGAWTVMQDHLIHYPLIMKHLTREQNSVSGKDADSSKPNNEKNLPITSSKGSQNNKRLMELETKAESNEMEAEEEKKRRAKIKEIIEGTVVPTAQLKKKKKKLNI